PQSFTAAPERVVAWLIEALVELGHEVTLFASGDSGTRGKLQPAWPRALRLGRPKSDPAAAMAALLETIARQARQFDVTPTSIGCICHCLADLECRFLPPCMGGWICPACEIWSALSRVLGSFRFPITSFGPLRRRSGWYRLPGLAGPLVSSEPRLRTLSCFSWTAHGRQGSRRGNPYCARAAGMPLRIAAKVPRSESGYFNDRLQPLIDGKQIQ